MSECESAVGSKPRTEMTSQLAGKLYDEAVARGACLTQLGLDVGDVPSRASYVGKVLANDPKDLPWDPYVALPKDPASWGKATAACPDRSLWGDYDVPKP